MQSRPLEFIGASGQRLSARLDLPEGVLHAYALFAHCFTCTKSSLAAVRIARALAARGVGVVRFDFTGLGQSGGDFADATFSSDVRDLTSVARQMTEQGLAPTLLVGHSLGGAAVIAAAHELPAVAAVAVIGAPFDVSHVTEMFAGGLQEIMDKGQAQVDLGGQTFTVRRSFVEDLAAQDQAARIAELGRPLLVMHSPRDEVVGIANASQIFLAARHPKSFVSLDDADHLLVRPADAAYAAEVIAAWSSRYLGKAGSEAESTAPSGAIAEAKGLEGFQVELAVGGVRLTADEPPEIGGEGQGPTPYDLVSGGLAACTAMTLRLYARQKAWPLDQVRVKVEHVKLPDGTPKDLFRREILMDGVLDAAQRAKLIEIAGRCPVHRTLAAGSSIETVAEEPAAAG